MQFGHQYVQNWANYFPGGKSKLQGDVIQRWKQHRKTGDTSDSESPKLFHDQTNDLINITIKPSKAERTSEI